MSPDTWAGTRVFVTGHTGFKGAWLTLPLADAGATVHGYALDPPTEPSFFRSCRIEPMLASHAVQPIAARVVSSGNVRLRLRQGSRTFDGYAAGMGKRIDQFRRPVDLAFTPRVVRGPDGATVELVVKDVVPSR